MLKIQLNNADEASELIFLFRELLGADRSFIAGNIDTGAAFASAVEQSGLPVEARLVIGDTVSGEPYRGLILALPHSSKRLIDDLSDCTCNLFLEKPFIFGSMSATSDIWPHATLEDRVIDTCLFALAGYMTPATAKLVQI